MNDIGMKKYLQYPKIAGCKWGEINGNVVGEFLYCFGVHENKLLRDENKPISLNTSNGHFSSFITVLKINPVRNEYPNIWLKIIGINAWSLSMTSKWIILLNL